MNIILKAIITSTLFFLFIYSCNSFDYITVKVRKSAFIPDSVEVNRDSLISGAIRICKMGQRYYHKKFIEGGGENSFVGFSISERYHTTNFGFYTMAVKKDLIKINGKGKLKGYNKYEQMEVECIASADNILDLVIKN